jgi:hypothetical protein
MDPGISNLHVVTTNIPCFDAVVDSHCYLQRTGPFPSARHNIQSLSLVDLERCKQARKARSGSGATRPARCELYVVTQTGHTELLSAV